MVSEIDVQHFLWDVFFKIVISEACNYSTEWYMQVARS